MKKITILDHYSQIPGENGNNRFIYLAEMLCREGHTVEIFTTVFSHKEKKNRIFDNIAFDSVPYRFHFFPELGYKKNISIKRLLSNVVFGFNIYRYLKRMSYKTDLFYIAVPSLTAAALVVKYSKQHDIPVIVDIQDIWPQAFKMVLNPWLIGSLVFAPQFFLTNYINRNAKAFVAVSQTYLKTTEKYTVPKLVVFLGTDLKNFNKYGALNIAYQKPENEFWIVYAGTLGNSYNIDLILKALSFLDPKKHKNTIFKILGDGPQVEELKESSKEIKIKVEFLGRIPYQHMVSMLLKADVAVNPIVDGAAQSIINKVADYAAAGLPVINTQECLEYRVLVENNNLGYNGSNKDPIGISKIIDYWYDNPSILLSYRENQLRIAAQLFDRRQTYGKIVDLIHQIIKP